MRERSAKRGWRVATGVALGITAALLAGPVQAGASGGCVTAEVASPLVLPDGRTFPAGKLTLCDSIGFNPVTTLHETFVDGMPVGLLKSERRASETAVDAEPVIVFQRADSGALHLVGYVLPGGQRSTTFVLRRIEPPRPTVARRGAGGGWVSIAAASAR